jgi:mannose-1-phosphate guanylyltransferase
MPGLREETSSMKTVKVLVLAGGLGTRLRPLTDHTPKCLVPLARRPLLDYWFERFDAAGIYDIRINNHHLPEQVREYIRNKNQVGKFRVSEAYEPQLLGSAGTVHANSDWVSKHETGLIVYADNLSNIDLSAMLKFHESAGLPMTMALFRTPYPEKCGIAELDSNHRIISFAEKPKQPKSNLANAGIYALTSDAYHEMAAMNKFDLGFDVLPAFVGRMAGWTWSGYHRDIGSHEALQQAEKDVVNLFPARTVA